ncbi:MAG: hypothetical protein DMG11_12570 [Acidobacteria bacterium]|nr:MAG: hypothetical protein DMG11_12570 [Acidobacteriota bacterium]
MKLAELCVKRPVFATMLVLTFVVLGLFSYTQLGIDQFPKVDLPTVTVRTVLSGASPEEVEQHHQWNRRTAFDHARGCISRRRSVRAG